MKKIAIALATVATIAAISAPAEARGGRNAAIGLGIAAGALAAGVAASSYNNGYGYNGYGYNGYNAYNSYDAPYNGGYYYGRPSYNRNHSNDPNPVDMNPYSPY
ncbi:MAG: hypothetical protein NTZ72_03180 [Afipia sp.]|jgi:hypothetical protein|nr:hypothetical protein [Afipia sp.]